MHCLRPGLFRALRFFLPLTLLSVISGCVPPLPAAVPQPGGGARIAVSNGGSVVTVTGTLIALPGNTLNIGFFHDPQNADCSMQADQHIVLTVLAQPQYGKLDVEPYVMDFPQYSDSSLMFKCSSGKVPGTELTYLAPIGFSGTDHLSYSVYLPNGREIIADTTIDVR